MFANRATSVSDPSPIGFLPASAAIPNLCGAPIVEGFTLLQRLGAGGQGLVWLAIRVSDGKKTAIKVIHADYSDNVRARARFEQAIASLASINHPGIVQSFEHGVLATGESWHATEYISGRTLLEFVNELDANFRRERGRDSRLPVDQIVRMFVKLSEAIEAAHRVGVIHRDLKPSNIIIDDSGNPHVLDFGLARITDSMGPQTLTITGEFIGSPAYASPEQVQCRPGGIDTRCDIYAIGMMLYECLTGSFPYDVSGALARTFEQIQYSEPVPPRTHAPWIDRDLQCIVLKSIAKDADRRYQSVAEMRSDLERFQRGMPVQARGDSVGYRLFNLVRRHRAIAVSAAAIVALSVAYTVSITVLYRRAVSAEAQAIAFSKDAKAKFRLAQDAAAFLVSGIDKNLRNLAGAETERRELMQKAQALFDPLIAEHGDDPSLQADIARVHVTLGDLAYKLGDFQDSLQHRRTALDIREKLAVSDPQDDVKQADLSISLVLVGDIDKEHDDISAAMKKYERALLIDEVLAAKNPANATFQDNLGWSLERVGCIAGHLGDQARRLELFTRRHEICEKQVAQRPSSLGRLYQLSASHLLLSDYLRNSTVENDARLSDEHGEKACAIAEQLFAAEPSNTQYSQNFVITRERLACNAYRRNHDYRLALEYANTAHEQAQRMHEAEPENFTFTKLWAESKGTLADIAWEQGEKEKSLGLYHDRLAIFEKVNQINSGSRGHQDRMVWLITHFDGVLASQSPHERKPESVALLTRCAALLPPEHVEVRRALKCVSFKP